MIERPGMTLAQGRRVTHAGVRSVIKADSVMCSPCFVHCRACVPLLPQHALNLFVSFWAGTLAASYGYPTKQ